MGKVGTVIIWLACLLGSLDMGFLQFVGDGLDSVMHFFRVCVMRDCAWLCVDFWDYA